MNPLGEIIDSLVDATRVIVVEDHPDTAIFLRRHFEQLVQLLPTLQIHIVHDLASLDSLVPLVDKNTVVLTDNEFPDISDQCPRPNAYSVHQRINGNSRLFAVISDAPDRISPELLKKEPMILDKDEFLSGFMAAVRTNPRLSQLFKARARARDMKRFPAPGTSGSRRIQLKLRL